MRLIYKCQCTVLFALKTGFNPFFVRLSSLPMRGVEEFCSFGVYVYVGREEVYVYRTEVFLYGYIRVRFIVGARTYDIK